MRKSCLPVQRPDKLLFFLPQSLANIVVAKLECTQEILKRAGGGQGLNNDIGKRGVVDDEKLSHARETLVDSNAVLVQVWGPRA